MPRARANKSGPTALEVFSAKRCRRSSLAEILGELHWVCLGLRQEFNALSPGFWQGRVYGAALPKARVYGTGSFRQRNAVRLALPKSRANGIGLARAYGRNIMPKVQVFGKEGSTAPHCQKPGQTSPGLRHWRSFRQRSAIGLALPKSQANGIGLNRAYGRNIMPKVRVFGKEGSTAPHCQKPGQTSPCLRHWRSFRQKKRRRSSLAEIPGEWHC